MRILLSVFIMIFASSAHTAEILAVSGDQIFVKNDPEERLPLGEIFVVADEAGNEKGQIQIVNTRGNSFEARVISGSVDRGDFFQGKELDDPEEFVNYSTDQDMISKLNENFTHDWRARLNFASLFSGEADISLAKKAFSKNSSLGLFVETGSANEGDLKLDHLAAGLEILYGFNGAFKSGFFWQVRAGVLQTSSNSEVSFLAEQDEDESGTETEDAAQDTFGALEVGYQWKFGRYGLSSALGYSYSTIEFNKDDLTNAEETAFGDLKSDYIAGNVRFSLFFGYTF